MYIILAKRKKPYKVFNNDIGYLTVPGTNDEPLVFVHRYWAEGYMQNHFARPGTTYSIKYIEGTMSEIMHSFNAYRPASDNIKGITTLIDIIRYKWNKKNLKIKNML